MAIESKLSNLIHVGKIGRRLLFLRKLTPQHFEWFFWDDQGSETATDIKSINAEEALRLASRTWKEDYFQAMNCGFRYTLPERDEHGNNALFYQMVASYSSPSGVYFDDELGGNCIVHNASLEARQLWNRLKSHEKTS